MRHPAAAALFVRPGNEGRVRVPIIACRRPHRLRLRAHHREAAVPFQLLAIAAVDQPPVGPRLGNDRLKVAHAASASFAPTDATAIGPSSSACPAARAWATLTP